MRPTRFLALLPVLLMPTALIAGPKVVTDTAPIGALVAAGDGGRRHAFGADHRRRRSA